MREIVENRDHPRNGRVVLVRDPHDGSGKDRWFVETQVRFEDEASARAFLELVTQHMRHGAPGPAGHAHDEKKLDRIMRLVFSWKDGDEPEGAPSPRRTLQAIHDILLEVP